MYRSQKQASPGEDAEKKSGGLVTAESIKFIAQGML